MGPPRDPLSVRYDGVVRDLVTRAARAHRDRKSVTAWPDWSLRLTWGPDSVRKASSGGRLARPVQVRLFKRSGARVTGPSWRDDPARQSKLGEGGVRVIGG